MATAIVMPKAGNSVEECILSKWRIKVGDTIKSGDIIALGGMPLEFYAISDQEEREQAMRLGVAERPLSPAKTLGYLTVFQIMMAVQ